MMSKPYKRSLHLLNIIAICLCSIILITCLGVIFTMDEMGLMFTSGSTLKTTLMDEAAYDFALWALADREHGYNAEFMEEKGCNIAVIEGEYDHIKDLDLNDDSTCVFKNFAGDLPAEYYTIGTYVSTGSTFSLSENMYDFLFRDNNYINDSYSYESEIRDIKGIGYDMLGQQAYIWDGEKFYSLNGNSYRYKLSEDGGTYNTTNIYERIWASQAPVIEDDNATVSIEVENDTDIIEKETTDVEGTETTEVEGIEATDIEEKETTEVEGKENTNNTDITEKATADNTEKVEADTKTITDTKESTSAANDKYLYIDGIPYSPLGSDDSEYVLELNGYTSSGALSLSNVADLTDLHDEFRDADIDVCSLESVSSVDVVSDSSYNLYTVFCFPRDNQASDSFFAQASRYLRLIPVLHVLLPVISVVAGLILILLVVLLVVRAGKYDNKGSFNSDIFASFPMEVMFALVCMAECMTGALVAYAIDDRLMAGSGGYLVLGIGALLAILVGTLWFESVVINFKSGHFYRNTLCYKIIMWFGRIIGGINNSIVDSLRNVKWSQRIIVICLLITFGEALGIINISNRPGLFFVWLIEKIILALVLFKVLRDYGKVKNAAVEMAAGNMDVTVNTDEMFIDLEEHGKALNEISSGLNNAISERMKSERMKTELITNVSHDIKTPLTSVINYVDLLEKEDFENETARGYLEVLDRQAKRLKKLIEDLIEASKAATGSIKFNIENVNARVLLHQSIGEFDDRLSDRNIVVITDVPEKDVYVKADNRYLFRVFDNLMSNIVKYSQEGTRAYVELKEENGRAHYTFKNISKDKLNISADELMERFVRGDRSRNTEGNGLGLSIARSLTESMGGKMELTVDGDLFKVDISFPEEVVEEESCA